MKKIVKKILVFLIFMGLFSSTTIAIVDHSESVVKKYKKEEKVNYMDYQFTKMGSSNEIELINNKPDVYIVNHDEGFERLSFVSNNSALVEIEEGYNLFDLVFSDSGNSYDSFCVTQNGLMLNPNTQYHISFKIQSNKEKDIRVIVNDYDHGSTLVDEVVKVQDNVVEFSFLSLNETSYSAGITLEIGGQNMSDLNIQISDITWSSDKLEKSIKVNQVGYELGEEKIAVFSYYDGDYFNIVNKNNEVVYQGTIVNKRNDEDSKEVVGYGYFSDFDDIGEYTIVSQSGNTSYPFVIQEDCYNNLLQETFTLISSQRCGYELAEEHYGDLAHSKCHDQLAQAYGMNFSFDAQGGWHDAGDYGRYTSTICKTTTDLLLTYLTSSDSFNDDEKIVESGNGFNDLLDEIKVGTDYLLKIQNDDGGIFHKVVSDNFAPFISPQDDKATVYALNVDTPSTAFASGVFAVASVCFQNIDVAYSSQLKDASLKAYEFVSQYGFIEQIQPDDITSGYYKDTEDSSERYFMLMSLWFMTKDETYLKDAIKYRSQETFTLDVNYNNPSMFGSFLYAIGGDLEDKSQKWILEEVINHAELIVQLSSETGYLNSIEVYHWGSNGSIANNAMICIMAYHINHDYRFIECAYNQLHYFLGRNALNISFITNVGDVYPENIHHRFTISNKVQIPGALVGGANESREDKLYTPLYNETTAPSKCYIDDEDSYATNEISIYYNSPLVFMLGNLISIN